MDQFVADFMEVHVHVLLLVDSGSRIWAWAPPKSCKKEKQVSTARLYEFVWKFGAH